jgi:hypothetical protein
MREHEWVAAAHHAGQQLIDEGILGAPKGDQVKT